MRIKIEFNTSGEPIVEVDTDECIVPIVDVTFADGDKLKKARVDIVGELGTFGPLENVRFEPTDQVDAVDEERVDISKKWPSWLKAAAVCKDLSGSWFSYQLCPIRGSSVWRGGGSSHINEELYDVILPAEWDWRTPILNPNHHF